MDTRLRSLSYVILFAGISVVSALGIGFLNNAYADNATMSDNMGMNATVNASANMAGNMNENMNMTNMHKILSPLQQFKSGTPAKNVQCDQGFTLVIKIEDGSPACVGSQIAQALTERGWGTTA
ncbi:MAG: hypothetical protein HY222_04645 [Thaumarchaeota archaeon]|nr:hypothetical protein [Nitrososphaerota archaeon]MBI3641665.1 hypothetical protein [Nitrososphaerota archaeon]